MHPGGGDFQVGVCNLEGFLSLLLMLAFEYLIANRFTESEINSQLLLSTPWLTWFLNNQTCSMATIAKFRISDSSSLVTGNSFAGLSIKSNYLVNSQSAKAWSRICLFDFIQTATDKGHLRNKCSTVSASVPQIQQTTSLQWNISASRTLVGRIRDNNLLSLISQLSSYSFNHIDRKRNITAHLIARKFSSFSLVVCFQEFPFLCNPGDIGWFSLIIFSLLL